MSKHTQHEFKQGYVYLLKNDCLDEKLRSTGATFFLVIECCPENMVKVAPVFTSEQNEYNTILINGDTYWISYQIQLLVSSGSFFQTAGWQVDDIQNILYKFRFSPSAYDNTPRKGDVCELVQNGTTKILVPLDYFFVIKSNSSKQITAVPIRKTIEDERLGFPVQIGKGTYWIHIMEDFVVPAEMGRPLVHYLQKYTSAMLGKRKEQEQLWEQAKKERKEAISMRKALRSNAPLKRVLPGTICTRNKALSHNNHLFLAIGIQKSIGTALVVPITTVQSKRREQIMIGHKRHKNYYAEVTSFIELPLVTLTIVPELQLESPENTILMLRRRASLETNPLKMTSFPIHEGDVCKLIDSNISKAALYYIVIQLCSEGTVLVAPIRKTNEWEKVSEKIIINGKEYFIDVFERQRLSTTSITVISYNHEETVRRVAKKRSSALKSIQKTQPIENNSVQPKNSPNAESSKKSSKQKKKATSFQEPPSVAPVSNRILYIYKGLIVCHRQKHSIVPVTATFYNGSGKEVKINVEYCQKCDRLLMNYTSFCLYREKFGVLIGNLRMLSSSSFNGVFNMSDESPLRLCGYTVSQENGLSSSTRHYILAKIIHDGIMSKVDVISYLENFIRLNGARSGNEIALEKWTEDLHFVHSYRIDTQPEVYITSVERY